MEAGTSISEEQINIEDEGSLFLRNAGIRLYEYAVDSQQDRSVNNYRYVREHPKRYILFNS
jgi:hypothetical protein